MNHKIEMENMNIKSLLISLLLISIVRSELSCLGLYKQKVSFYLVQTVPSRIASQDKIHYGYTDDTNTNSSFHISYDDSLFTPLSPISTTLSQLNDDSSVNFIQWDDYYGQSKLSSFSKGLLAINEESEQGFFFGYSMNNFLSVVDGKVTINPSQNEQINGQSYMCLSLNKQNLEKVADNLLITKMNIQFNNIFSPISFPKLSKLKNNLNTHFPLEYKDINILLSDSDIPVKMITQNYWIYYNSFISSEYETLTIDDQISKILNCDILFKSSKPSVNQCQPHYTSETIFSLKFGKSKWDSIQDKSKWIICKNPDSVPYVCISDLDNYTPRYQHGGNLFCIQNKQLYQIYQNMVEGVQVCSFNDIKNSQPRQEFPLDETNDAEQQSNSKSSNPEQNKKQNSQQKNSAHQYFRG